MKTIAAIIVLILFLSGCAGSSDLQQSVVTIGTFNIAWLGDGIKDNIQRSDEDYKRIGTIIAESGADIFALQEIENAEALEQVLKYAPGYSYIVGKEGRAQNVAVIYKSTVKVSGGMEYMPLSIERGRNRPGLLINCKKGNFDWAMMIVHLKSSSRYDSTAELKIAARITRQRQAELAQAWADSMLKVSNEKDLLIVGDFNDFPQRKKDPTLTPFLQDSNLRFLTYDLKSCRNEQMLAIDHFLASQQAARRLKIGSERMINIPAMFPKDIAEKISDHCPVLMQFDIQSPDND
jgi:endonuclease/exonuclease/phosphatase family metal-dependent hydrolase